MGSIHPVGFDYEVQRVCLRSLCLGRIASAAKILAGNDVARTMRWFRAPGTFGVHDRDDEPVICLIHTHQAFTGQPLARETTQDPHPNS
jgi:hypothetical protein